MPGTRRGGSHASPPRPVVPEEDKGAAQEEEPSTKAPTPAKPVFTEVKKKEGGE